MHQRSHIIFFRHHVDVGTVFNKKLNHVDVPSLACPHQRGASVACIVDISASVYEQPNHINIASHSRHHQRSASIRRASRVDVDASFDDIPQLAHVHIALTRAKQRFHVEHRASFHPRAVSREFVPRGVLPLHRLQLAHRSSPAPRTPRVDRSTPRTLHPRARFPTARRAPPRRRARRLVLGARLFRAIVGKSDDARPRTDMARARTIRRACGARRARADTVKKRTIR